MRKRALYLSVGMNAVLFLLVFAFQPPIWATNDDYRMAVILSGAYLGEPSADAVFLQYPLGWLLSRLYALFPRLPVYGIYTELALFISCCVIAVTVMKRVHGLWGAALYGMLYLFALRKYTVLPQFTLTSAYLAIAASVIVYDLPQSARPLTGALLAAALSLFSFLTRAKAFYLMVPVLAVIIAWHAMRERRMCRYQAFYAIAAFACIVSSLLVSERLWQREEYAAYRAFNTARHRVYDYGEIPFFYDDAAFYLENGIDETLYRQIEARYLDMDARLDADMLDTVADRIEEVTNGDTTVIERALRAFLGSLESWFSSTDPMLAYTSLLALGIFVLHTAGTLAYIQAGDGSGGLFTVIFAGLFLESAYFVFIGRTMARQMDALLIAACVLGIIMTIDQVQGGMAWSTIQRTAGKPSSVQRIACALAVTAAASVLFSAALGANAALCGMHEAAINRNAKLEALDDYADANPENFYFYDTQYFISSTDDVFETYDASRPLNMESLGSWNVGSPSYQERNRRMGFDSAIEGLTKHNHVYFVAVAEPRLAMTRTLKQLYNKRLCEVEMVQAANCVLHVYSVVGDE